MESLEQKDIGAEPLPNDDPHLVLVDEDYRDPIDERVANGRRQVPINMRQSGESTARALTYTRLRKSPYWHLSERHGCYANSVYNHMYHPRAYVPTAQGAAC